MDSNVPINNYNFFNMKKFFMMMVALVATISMSAQTYVAPKFTDNTYVSLRYGVTALMHPECNGFDNFGHSLAQQSELQFGKWVTPRFAVALDGVVSWDTFSHQKLSEYTVPFITVSALAKYRFVDTNKFAFTTAAGPGWAHGFVKKGYDSNDLMTKFQLEFTYKVTDRLDVDVVPELNYNLTSCGTGMNPYFDSRDAWYGLNVGVTYRLGDKFQECPFKYTQAHVDDLNAKINQLRAENDDLRNAPAKVVTNTVEKVTEKAFDNKYVVTFAQGSAEITARGEEVLNQIPAGKTVSVVGTTSPEGSTELNNKLSVQRAEAVASYLKNRGVKVTTVSGTDAGRLGIVTVE